MRYGIGTAAAWLLLVLGAANAAAQSTAATDRVHHGIGAGEVTATTAVVWARCNHAGVLTVRAKGESGKGETVGRVAVTRARDFTGRVQLDGLQPETLYEYQAICGDFEARRAGGERLGRFRTAPPDDAPRAVRLAWSGDLGGQNVCRDAKEGYAIFDVIRDSKPDFFIALGDMIYADSPCRAAGRYGNEQVPGLLAPATKLEDLWTAWRYNRSDRAFDRFLAEVPVYPVWDDHEIANDAGPQHDHPKDAPTAHLLPIARQAFLDYQPLQPNAGERMHRRRRWGNHLELFILDTRQYRDSNSDADRAVAPKSMLGKDQRTWLTEGVAGSNATWKVIVSSVPISIPTGDDKRGRDGWANVGGPTGFENELREILESLRGHRVKNLIWLTTDVHFAAGFAYKPFNADADFVFHEFISGPLNAGVFPNDIYDDSFGPQRLFLYGPLKPAEITSFADAKRWFNFGELAIDETGNLTVRIVNWSGQEVYNQRLTPR